MLDEFMQLSVAQGQGRPGRWFLILGALVAASFLLGLTWVIAALRLSSLCLLSSTVLGHDLNTAFDRIAGGLGGLLYCCVLFGFLILIRTKPVFDGGADRILVLFAIVWAGDSAAYYGGRAI